MVPTSGAMRTATANRKFTFTVGPCVELRLLPEAVYEPRYASNWSRPSGKFVRPKPIRKLFP